MKLSPTRSKLSVVLPCLGIAVFGALTVLADPPERTGADAPHHERNEAKNEKKSALPLSDVNVPAFSDSQKPVRRATAVTTSSTSQGKAKDRRKVAQQAKEKPKTEAIVAETKPDRSRNEAQVDDIVGSDAPHQERSSDPNKRAARLFIWER
jgi:hypothetical protein